MNRKARRILEKKLGSDFPLDDMFALMEYYNNTHDDKNITFDDFIVILLKKYIPIEYHLLVGGISNGV